MGSHPYYYTVEFQPDAGLALQELRLREFAAGRYHPVEPPTGFPIGPDSPSPGAEHESIDAARADAAGEGTRSILDIVGVSHVPGPCVAVQLPPVALAGAFGTPRPTMDDVRDNLDFLEEVEPGHCVFFPVYDGDIPAEWCFAGHPFE